MDSKYLKKEFVLLNSNSAGFEIQHIINNTLKDSQIISKNKDYDEEIRIFIFDHMHLYPVVYGLDVPEEVVEIIQFYADYIDLEPYFKKIFNVSTLEDLNRLFQIEHVNRIHDHLFRFYLIGKLRLLNDHIHDENDMPKDNLPLNFKKKVICFTGALENMTRQDAFTLIYELGGYPTNQITRDTDYLVVSNASIKYSSESSKLILAKSLQRKGSPIQIISETQFMNSIKN